MILCFGRITSESPGHDPKGDHCQARPVRGRQAGHLREGRLHLHHAGGCLLETLPE